MRLLNFVFSTLSPKVSPDFVAESSRYDFRSHPLNVLGFVLRHHNMWFLCGEALISERTQGPIDSSSILICGFFLQLQTPSWLWNIIFLKFPQYLL